MLYATNRHHYTFVVFWLTLVIAGTSSAQEQEFRFEKDIVAYEKKSEETPLPENCSMFVGSSTWRLWGDLLERDFAEFQAVNRGFGGSTVPDVLHVMDRIITPHKPARIVFSCGGNDIVRGTSSEKTFENFKTFLSRLHAESPHTEVFFISITGAPSRERFREQMLRYDALVKEFAGKTPKLHYIDTTAALAGEDGKAEEKYYLQDRLHLNREGQQRWFLVITKALCEADWDVRDHIPLQDITVQAHRGAGVLAPENSLEAFEIAWNLGVIPEADIRMTKDGVIVSFHDNDFSRILPTASDEMKKKGIKDLSYDEVIKLDIGTWKGKEFEGQRIPCLREIVAILTKHPKRKIYVDIKNVDFERLAVETRDVHPQIILASTKYEEIQHWKKVAPTSFTLHWMGGTEEKLTERLEHLKENGFQGVDQLQIHVRINEEGSFEPGDPFLRKTGNMLRQYGILFQVLPWDGKDTTVYRRLLNLGVASFATDYPDVTMRAIVEHYAR